MVALEAMNAGLPVIAPRVGGLRDYGEDARVLWIEAPTSDAIAGAVERAMDDPSLLQSMRDAAGGQWMQGSATGALQRTMPPLPKR